MATAKSNQQEKDQSADVLKWILGQTYIPIPVSLSPQPFHLPGHDQRLSSGVSKLLLPQVGNQQQPRAFPPLPLPAGDQPMLLLIIHPSQLRGQDVYKRQL